MSVIRSVKWEETILDKNQTLLMCLMAAGRPTELLLSLPDNPRLLFHFNILAILSIQAPTTVAVGVCWCSERHLCVAQTHPRLHAPV